LFIGFQGALANAPYKSTLSNDGFIFILELNFK